MSKIHGKHYDEPIRHYPRWRTSVPQSLLLLPTFLGSDIFKLNGRWQFEACPLRNHAPSYSRIEHAIKTWDALADAKAVVVFIGKIRMMNASSGVTLHSRTQLRKGTSQRLLCCCFFILVATSTRLYSQDGPPLIQLTVTVPNNNPPTDLPILLVQELPYCELGYGLRKPKKSHWLGMSCSRTSGMRRLG